MSPIQPGHVYYEHTADCSSKRKSSDKLIIFKSRKLSKVEKKVTKRSIHSSTTPRLIQTKLKFDSISLHSSSIAASSSQSLNDQRLTSSISASKARIASTSSNGFSKRRTTVKLCKCGSTSHSRTTSKQCSLNVKAVQPTTNRNKVSDEKSELFVRKMGLNKFVRDDAQYIIPYIKANVKVVSRWMIELSLLVNYVWREKVDHGEQEYFDDLKGTRKVNTIRNLLYAIQGKADHKATIEPLPADYAAMRKRANLPVYRKFDTFNRSFIAQQAVEQSIQNLEDNIQRRMFSRMKRYMCKIRELDSNEARTFIKNMFTGVEQTDGDCGLFENQPLQFNQKLLNQHPFSFIPVLFRMQQELAASGEKSFHVVPMNRYKLRHIDLNNSGLKELIHLPVTFYRHCPIAHWNPLPRLPNK